MKKQLCIALVLFWASPAQALNFDELFGGLGDGPDPFGDIFAAPPGGDPFAGPGGSMGMFGDAPAGGEDEKKTEAPKVKSRKEAFSTPLPDGIKKIPTIYKEALEEFLGRLSEKLNDLSVQLSDYALGITLKEQLEPTVATITLVNKLCETVRTQSIYYPALLSKEYNSLRQRITKSYDSIDKVTALFFDLEDTDSLNQPSSRQKRKQKQAYDKVIGLVKRSIEPMETDFNKVIENAKSSQRLADKKKKYDERAQKAAGSSGGQAFGGWGSDASGYFNDGYDMGGLGTGGWDFGMGGNNWDNMFGGNDFGGGFGGGFDSGFGGFGGYGDSGGYGNDFGGSYGGSTDSSSSGDSSGSGKVLFGNPLSESDTESSYNADDDQKKGFGGNPFNQGDLAEEAPPVDRYYQLAAKMIDRLNIYLAEYNKASNKDTVLRALLSERIFSADINRLSTLAQLSVDPAVTTSLPTDKNLQATATSFTTALKKAIPFLIHAAKYASPAFSTLIDEHALQAEDSTVDRDSAKLKSSQSKHYRKLSYEALMKWLYLIRQTGQEDIQQAAVNALQQQAEEVIASLNAVLDKVDTTQYLPYDETEKLEIFSRQLLQEPVVIGYSSIPTETPAQSADRKDRFATLVASKNSLEKRMLSTLEGSTTLFKTMRQVLQDAILKVREEIDDKAAILKDPSARLALGRHIEQILNSTHAANPALSSMKKVMIPYKEDFFQHLEVQVVLHEKMLELWKHEEELPTSDYTPPPLTAPAQEPNPQQGSPALPLTDLPAEQPPAPAVPQTAASMPAAPAAAAAPRYYSTDDLGGQAGANRYDELYDEPEDEGFAGGLMRKAESSGVLGWAKKTAKQFGQALFSDGQNVIRGKARSMMHGAVNGFAG